MAREGRPLDELGARDRWDRQHMTSLTTKLDERLTAAFDAACQARGISRYEALRRYCIAVAMRPETIDCLKWRRAPRRRKEG